MKFIFIFVLLLYIVNPVYSQIREKFEPEDGRVIHGLGQYEGYFYDDKDIWYDNKVYESIVGKAPLLYSVYASFDSALRLRNPTDYNDIQSAHDYPYLLVVGLLLHDSKRNINVNGIINGEFDSQITAFANRLKKVKSPVFLRPGFEFGENNRGFHNTENLTADGFKEIWKRIYSLFSKQNVLNVAFVWNTVNTASFEYINWYPGDDFVDWWGINIFNTSQMRNARLFIANAKKHNKPVMICESNPITLNGTLNDENWEKWFVPFFKLIKSAPQVKAFVYTNSPWSKGPFSSWPDSRIAKSTLIGNKFKKELAHPMFISMDEYLSNPNVISK